MATAGERWDERYRRRDLVALPAGAPALLVEHRHLLSGGGRALDLACGTGRSARYLADAGYEVVAVDASAVVVDALRTAARDLALPVDARVVDLEREPVPPGPYDVVTVFNFLQRDLFGPIEDAVAPGGLLVYETLGAAHAEELGNSFNPDYLLARDELLTAFPALTVLTHRDGVVRGPDGPRGIASLVARRPA